MRRIIRSRDGRPCRRRLLRTPLPVRRTLVWQEDRWLVQPVPNTLWLGLASNPNARACDHVPKWPQPPSQVTQYTYKSAQVWHGGDIRRDPPCLAFIACLFFAGADGVGRISPKGLVYLRQEFF